MNQFSVNPLGGFDPVGAVSALKQQNKAEDAQKLQLEQEENRKAAFSQALDGTPESMENLRKTDPYLFMFMEDRNNKRIQTEGAARNEIKKQTEHNWRLRYKEALTSNNVEAQQALILEAKDDDNNDLEYSAIGKDPEADLVITNAALFEHLKKDGYANLYGGETLKSEDKTANAKDWATYQQLKKQDPESAKQFGQKVGFVSKEGRELSSYHQKQLTKYSDSSVEASSLANEFEVMANDFEKLDPVAGGAGAAYEFLKEATGSEDAVSELKRKYLKIRASQLVKNLPPGAASEKDVQLALSGFPKSTANAGTMASFMRGLSKLQRFEADYSNFRSGYLSENATERGMLQAWKEKSKVEADQLQQQPKPTQTATGPNGEKIGLINGQWVKM